MKAWLVLLFSLCAASAYAASRPAAFAEPGDPPRWYEPEPRYENAMHEARNALADALAECRAGPREERGECESEARQRYRDDVEYARRFLEPQRQVG